jgi:ubiquitin C
MHLNKQHLAVASKQLANGGTPANYTIHRGMRIYVKSLAGKTVTVDAELSDTINDIKDMVNDSYGANP